jgi:glutathione S-transferase
VVLYEKEIPFVLREEKLSDPSPELLRANPSGQVPVLILEDGRSMPESAVITRFLEERFPEPALVPSGAWPAVERWTEWCDVRFKPWLDRYKYDWSEMAPEAQTDLERVARGLFSEIETALERGPWLLGGQFTLADAHLFPFLRQWDRSHPDGRERFSFPLLWAWLDRAMARLSFERAMGK